MPIAQTVLDLITPIPADQFITENYTNGVNKCDVLGHLNRLISENPADYSKSTCGCRSTQEIALRNASREFLAQTSFGSADISYVNRAPVLIPYTERSIKDRVVHLLNDMITAGY